MPRHTLTQEVAVALLMKHRAKLDIGNKVVRDANFLGNKLNGVVDFLVHNHGWSRTNHESVTPCHTLLL